MMNIILAGVQAFEGKAKPGDLVTFSLGGTPHVGLLVKDPQGEGVVSFSGEGESRFALLDVSAIDQVRPIDGQVFLEPLDSAAPYQLPGATFAAAGCLGVGPAGAVVWVRVQKQIQAFNLLDGSYQPNAERSGSAIKGWRLTVQADGLLDRTEVARFSG